MTYTQSIITREFGFFSTNVTHVIPVEMVSLVAFIISTCLMHPFFAYNAFAVPHAAIKIKSTNLCKILHC